MHLSNSSNFGMRGHSKQTIGLYDVKTMNKNRRFFTVDELVTKKLFKFKRKLVIRKTDCVLKR